MKYLVNYLIIICMVLYGFCHVYASSQSQNKDLNKSNYTVMGLTIGECSRHDILSKLGPTLMIKDEENTHIDHLCYISDRDETLIIFSFKANQCARFQMMSRKHQFYKWHFCAVSPLVTEEMSTESGITLGMHKDQLKTMLGTPKKDSDEILVFEYKRKIPMENEELKKGSQYFEDRNIDSSRTVSIYVEARFVDSELSSFDMSLH
jgi:hypothetical protein